MSKTKLVAKFNKPKETILVFSAHTDDFVLGAGGTIANYIAEGKKVIAIIFSLGEKSHPWLKDKEIKKVRAEETAKAGKFMGCKEIVFSLKDQHIYEEYRRLHLDQQIIKIIEKERPSKIFTHSQEDIHPDHKAVNKITLEILDKTDFRPELYIYSIWNPVSLKTNYPSLYINISKTFSIKWVALRIFRSQQVYISYPVFLLLFHNFRDGLHIRKLFAERFFRIR